MDIDTLIKTIGSIGLFFISIGILVKKKETSRYILYFRRNIT
jgi:hypothetical protein